MRDSCVCADATATARATRYMAKTDAAATRRKCRDCLLSCDGVGWVGIVASRGLHDEPFQVRGGILWRQEGGTGCMNKQMWLFHFSENVCERAMRSEAQHGRADEIFELSSLRRRT